VETLLAWAVHFLRGLWIALLPSPEREDYARRHGHDAPRWSLGFGFVQGGLGVALFVIGGLAFMRGSASILSWGMLESWQPGLTTNEIRATGVIGWLAWFICPLSWPPAYLAMVGLVRCATFAITREAVGEPLALATLRLIQALRLRRNQRVREEELGPVRPDSIALENGDVVVLTSREKNCWEEEATVEVAGRYYRLVSVEERTDGDSKTIAYRLREAASGNVIRRLVRYSPPPEWHDLTTHSSNNRVGKSP
jgi:hypothetical protein